MLEKIAVVGGGAWGTALANLAAESGREVELYIREEDAAAAINSVRENTYYLKGVTLNPGLRAVSMAKFGDCDAAHLIWTVPTQFSRTTARAYKDVLKGKNILNASKGIEIESGKLVIDTLQDEFEADFSILSGPTFAIEVAKKYPTAASIASYDIEMASWWQQQLSTGYFRAYTATDVVGLEIGGALKNVIAVAAGIADGLNFGYNARAAIITRGLAEIIRFGIAYGADRETFLGLSGIGDLVLTTTSDNSRNRQTGLKIAAGETFEEISSRTKTVAEGVFTAKAAHFSAEKLKISMPITDEVYKIIFENKPPVDSFKDLMSRPVNKKETE